MSLQEGPFGRLPVWTSYIHASELRRQWSANPYSGDIATCGKSQFCKNKEDSFSKVSRVRIVDGIESGYLLFLHFFDIYSGGGGVLYS